MALRHTRLAKEALKVQARTLYESGMLVKAITVQLQVGNGTVQRWCEDLIAARKLQRSLNAQIPKPEGFTGFSELKDDDVIAIRKSVRASGKKNWDVYAKQYNVSVKEIRLSVQGEKFKHLDGIEAPVLAHEAIKSIVFPTAVIKELVDLRRQDPATWSFAKLAERLSQKTGNPQNRGSIAKVLYRFDPTLKTIVVPRAKRKIPKKKVSAAVRKRELDIKNKMLAEENAYEDWVAAGRPDDWIWPE